LKIPVFALSIKGVALTTSQLPKGQLCFQATVAFSSKDIANTDALLRGYCCLVCVISAKDMRGGSLIVMTKIDVMCLPFADWVKYSICERYKVIASRTDIQVIMLYS